MVLSALGLPEWVVIVSYLPIPWLGDIYPYLGLFVIAATILNFRLATLPLYGGMRIRTQHCLAVLFMIAIFGIELFHISVKPGNVFIQVHMQLFWIFVLYFAFESFRNLVPGCRQLIVVAVVAYGVSLSAAYFLIAHVLPSLGIRLDAVVRPDQFVHSAYIAYSVVFALAVLLFEYRPASQRGVFVQYGIYFPILMLTLLLQRISAPFLIALVIIALKMVMLIRMTLPRAVSLIIGVSVLGGGIVMFLSVDANTWRGLTQSQYYLLDVGTIHGDQLSSYVRRETILEALRLFLGSPILGVGAERSSQIGVLHWGLHSSLGYYLSSFGLLGTGLLFAFLAVITLNAVTARGIGMLAYPMIICAFMVFSPTANLWWSVVFYLLSDDEPAPGGRADTVARLRMFYRRTFARTETA